MRMNSFDGKSLLAFVRNGDFAHPGEAQAIDIAFGELPACKSANMLDVGCGLGGTAGYVAERWGNVTGIDIDAASIVYARETFPKVSFLVGDAQNLGDLNIGKFDIVYSFTVIYALDDKRSALGSMTHLLGASGYILILDYRLDKPEDRRDSELLSGTPISRQELDDILRDNGLHIVKYVDITESFVVWYDDLLVRIASSRVARRYSPDVIREVANKYDGIRAALKAGVIGGMLVVASRVESIAPR